eukprot:TRINITY_DN3545_c0_g1_i4.p1 TRINITY_DN3545_c0_g1~~TRINITY_DN3545_c0_g1_i4.p1  ORF type:complete len:714 (-),score=102.80 TRINITY_DN3545_c0_g1_i4:48-2189(-)
MGKTLIFEIKNSRTESFIIRGLRDPNLDCKIALEYQSSETAPESATLSANGATLERFAMTSRATDSKIVREIVLHSGRATAIKDLSLNINGTDCAPYITEFSIWKGGENLELASCRKNNIKCHYVKSIKGAVVVADCRGTLPKDAEIRLGIGKDPAVPRQLKAMVQNEPRTLNEFSLEGKLELLENEECGMYTMKNIRMVLSETVPAGAYLNIITFDGCNFVLDDSNLNDFIVHEFISWDIELEMKQEYSDVLLIPDRIVKTLDSYCYLFAFLYDKRGSDGGELLSSNVVILSVTDSYLSDLALTPDSGVFTAMEPNAVTLTFTPRCYIRGAIEYAIYLPDTHSIRCTEENAICLSGNLIAINHDGLRLEKTSIKFFDVFPATTKPISPDDTYVVSIFDEIYFYGSYPENVPVLPGSIPLTVLTMDDNLPKARSTYTFDIMLEYPTVEGSKILIDFHPSVTFTSDFSCQLKVFEIPAVPAVNYMLNRNLIIVNSLPAISYKAKLLIIIKGVLNPEKAGDYSGIFVSVQNALGETIVKSRELTAGINYDSCMEGCGKCTDKVTCDACKAPYKKWNDVCLLDCPESTLDVDGICTPCADKCEACQITTDYCTVCKNDKVSYKGECYETCIEGTGLFVSVAARYCFPCPLNCIECVYWGESLQLGVCTNCTSGYVLTETFPFTCVPEEDKEEGFPVSISLIAVSYTHLTLPTICSV